MLLHQRWSSCLRLRASVAWCACACVRAQRFLCAPARVQALAVRACIRALVWRTRFKHAPRAETRARRPDLRLPVLPRSRAWFRVAAAAQATLGAPADPSPRLSRFSPQGSAAAKRRPVCAAGHSRHRLPVPRGEASKGAGAARPEASQAQPRSP